MYGSFQRNQTAFSLQEIFVYICIFLVFILNFHFFDIKPPKITQNKYFQFYPYKVSFQVTNSTPPEYIESKTPILSRGEPNNFVTASKKLTFRSGFHRNTLKHLSTAFIQSQTTLYVLKNSYGTDKGCWACGNYAVHLKKSYFYPSQYLPQKFNSRRGKLVFEVDEILLIGHKRCQNNYGHFLADKCVSLMLLPQELKERCYIIGNDYYPVVNEGLLALGFRKEQIINTTFGQWFFAKKLYVLNEYRPINCMGGPAVNELRMKFFECFDLDAIPATRYGMVNRKSKARNIANFDELYNLTHIRFPNYPWELIPDYAGNLSETARLWTSFRFVFVIVGSSATKGLFMKPYTVMCIPFCNFFDYTLMNLLSNSLHAIRICSSGMKMFKAGTFPIKLNESLNSIGDCLYYDKYKKWPASSS